MRRPVRRPNQQLRPGQSFDSIRVALMLAVVTTVFAFMSNSFSPPPPLRTFGATLALGVISAFIASTITVGAVHVVAEGA